ncbi:hypothetical protein [Microbacterium album]|uniref:Uncharacterized protein n=1 Tax=Microbacterium album TaxID=2053191 RepID=A0A917MM25_9MICO|nr:hypothetical protein [Microbacterium album]GGH45695.1 hypothetical protein GCM10010921_21260 [Microbacterium album]
MAEFVLVAVLGVLLLNVVGALLASIRQRSADSWLLTLLLASTSAAAIVAVLAVITDAPRLVEISLVFTATAAVTAAIRLTAQRRRAGSGAGSSAGGR